MSSFATSPGGFSLTLDTGHFVLVQWSDFRNEKAQINIIPPNGNKAEAYYKSPEELIDLLHGVIHGT